MQDDRIIELFWQRDEAAIEQTDEKYGSYCSSIAMQILENRESVKECVNDTWLRAWESIPPQRPSALRLFLGKITRNLSLNRARDLAREKRGGGQAVLALDELLDCVPAAPSPETVLENREITASIERWLSALPRENRVTFMLRYWHCESAASVARRLGWTESKTSSLLRRLRISLKSHLESEGIYI